MTAAITAAIITFVVTALVGTVIVYLSSMGGNSRSPALASFLPVLAIAVIAALIAGFGVELIVAIVRLM